MADDPTRWIHTSGVAEELNIHIHQEDFFSSSNTEGKVSIQPAKLEDREAGQGW
jgi:hypothetical protein